MLRLYTLTILIAFCFCSLCTSDVETLITGINDGLTAIKSGEVVATVTYTRQPWKTEEEIALWKETEREQQLKAFSPEPAYPDIDIKKFEAEYLTPHLDFLADWYRDSTEIEVVTTLFELLPEAEQRQEPYRYKVMLQQTEGLSLDSEKAQHIHGSLFYGLTYDQNLQVREEIGNAHFAMHPKYAIRLSQRGHAAGFFDYSVFGRSVAIVPPDAQVVGKEQIDGAECYILEFNNARGDYVKIWVDVEKDFCIRKLERRKSRDTIVQQREIYKDFVKFSGIWYPKFSDTTIYDDAGTMVRNLRIEVLTAEFNVTFPEGFFDIDRNFYFRDLWQPYR